MSLPDLCSQEGRHEWPQLRDASGMSSLSCSWDLLWETEDPRREGRSSLPRLWWTAHLDEEAAWLIRSK